MRFARLKVQNRKLACVALRSQDKLREVPTSRLESSWQEIKLISLLCRFKFELSQYTVNLLIC